MSGDRDLEGLGGWLVLVGLGIVFAPFRILLSVIPIYYGLFTDGSYEVLTTPGSAAYHPMWGPIIYGEMAVNLALTLGWVYVGVLFFTKRTAFPMWFIILAVCTPGVVVADALVIKSMLPEEPVFDRDMTRGLARSLISILIWVPYMLVSKRVKATFVN